MRKQRNKKNLPFKPFDVTTKQLVETDPGAWLEYAGLPTAPVEVIDADLSTVAVAADKVIRVDGAKPYLLNLEFMSTYEEDFGDRFLLYCVLLRRRHHMRVKSVVLLLRPEADGAAMTGRVQEIEDEEDGKDFSLDFGYRIIRIWQQPVENFLTGRLVLLTLAPLGNVERERLPEVIERMRERFEEESSYEQRRELWAATFLMMGLRYENALIEQLLKGVQGMEESTTYQLILSRGEAKGEAKEARKLVLRLGCKRFGEPDAVVQKALRDASLERLEEMADRLLQAESWQELLQ